MSDDAMIRKTVCDKFELLIVKSVPQKKIEFFVHNTSEKMFLFKLWFFELTNLKVPDGQLERSQLVMPGTSSKVCEFLITGSFSYKYQFSYLELNQEASGKTIEVDTDLLLRILQDDSSRSLSFEIHNNSKNVAKFELSIIEMVNIRGKDLHKLSICPNSSYKICQLEYDWEWSFNYSYKHAFVPVIHDQKLFKRDIKRQAKENRAKLMRIDIETSDIEFYLENIKFCDPFFLPQSDWRRPETFVCGEIMLFSDKKQTNNIVFDWLRCCVCLLENNSSLLSSVFMTKDANPYGFYKFNMFKTGRQSFVVVDDHVSFSFTEIWHMLLEKAFGKIIGSYKNLELYTCVNALIDLTGCPTYKLEASEIQDKTGIIIGKKDSEYHFVERIDEHNFKINEECLNIFDISKLFNEIILCEYKNFTEKRIFTALDKYGRSRECLRIDIKQTSRVVISVHQEDFNAFGASQHRPPIDLGILILNSEGGLYEYSPSLSISRQIFLERVLTPGQYIIIPISTASGLHLQQGQEFHLNHRKNLSTPFMYIVKDLFYRLSKSYSLSYEDFEPINSAFDLLLTPQSFETRILAHYASSDGLTCQGLLEFFTEELLNEGEDKVREGMKKLGYDHCLNSIESKPITVVCQSEEEFEASSEILDERLALSALTEFIERTGSIYKQEENHAIKYLRADHGCYFLIINLSTTMLQFNFDFSPSENVKCLMDKKLSINVKHKSLFQQLVFSNPNPFIDISYTVYPIIPIY